MATGLTFRYPDPGRELTNDDVNDRHHEAEGQRGHQGQLQPGPVVAHGEEDGGEPGPADQQPDGVRDQQWNVRLCGSGPCPAADPDDEQNQQQLQSTACSVTPVAISGIQALISMTLSTLTWMLIALIKIDELEEIAYSFHFRSQVCPEVESRNPVRDQQVIL